MTHPLRPRFTPTPDALLTRHPVQQTLVELTRSNTGAYTPHPLDISSLHDPFLLGQGLAREQAVCIIPEHGNLELREPHTLALIERIEMRGDVVGMWSSGRYIYQMTTSPPRLLSLDLESQRRSSRSIPHLDGIQDSHISRDGRWLVIAGAHHARSAVHVYDLGTPLYPVLHLDGLDVRGVHSPLGDARQADMAVWCARDHLFVCMARLGDEAFTWPGWRGSVGCVELATGRLSWHAELDAELTGDWRAITDLGRDEALSPALCAHEERLWVGGLDASVLELDARDGALRQAHYHASAYGTLAIHHDPTHDELVMMDERGQVSALTTS